ncbi:MAG: hypothetical protein LBM93_00855, partial [Oscillospiraceae bacterium]|nr:hypothetical protein [Oscillospiraceae bacterium]
MRNDITENQVTIGFDIGDAETIVAFSTSGNKDIGLATMPGKSACGQAMATIIATTKDNKTAFAEVVSEYIDDVEEVSINFKRRPSHILDVTEERKLKLISIGTNDINHLLDEPEFNSPDFGIYLEKLTQFVDAILQDNDFIKNARGYLVGADSIRFCIGHPTKWDSFDKLVYEAMLRSSMLGKKTYLDLPMYLDVYPESRAALLYVKDQYGLKFTENEYIGLVDFGSSTIDISVMYKAAKNPIDFGNETGNYLGARCIDYIIAFQYFFENVNDVEYIEELKNENKCIYDAILINSRFAKEKLFSSTSDPNKRRTNILVENSSVRISYDTLINDILKRPIAPILKEYTNLPENEYHKLGNLNYVDAFKNFMRDVKFQMAEAGVNLSRIFLTGSASRMDFVKPVIEEVFTELRKENSMLYDSEPSNAIAKGLSKVGQSERLAFNFKKQ